VSFSMIKVSLAACFVLTLGAAIAPAAESTSATPTPAASTPAAAAPSAATPPAAAPSAAAPAPASAAALGYAATILNDIGLKPSLDRVVPAMFGQLQQEVLATRPELKDPLAQAMQIVGPDFVKSEQVVLDDLAKFLAAQMTEQELKDTAAFYESPTGKKYASTQGVLTVYLSKLAGAWRDEMSTDVLARIHAELKKTGHDF
jgi:uncharacterized protein